MKSNWKTSLFGLIAAGAAFLALYGPDIGANKKLVAAGKFIAAGGLASLGIAAKDGGNKGDAPQ